MTAETEFIRRRSDLVVVAVGLLVLVVCSLAVRSGEVSDTEERVFDAINGLSSAIYNPMWPVMQLGNLVVGPLVAIGAAVMRRWRLVIAVLLVTVGKLVVERIVKLVVERERPGATVDDVTTRGDVPLSGESFVSGHLVLVAGLAMVVVPYLPGRWKILPWVLVGLVGFGRVYVGAHNPLDIVGGIGLGLALGGVVNLAVGVPRESADLNG